MSFCLDDGAELLYGPASATEPSAMANIVDLSSFMFPSQGVEHPSRFALGAGKIRRVVGTIVSDGEDNDQSCVAVPQAS